ncbi:MAG: amidohydrolase [Candidatus Heimdallarchaeota archaeon]|nr:MAG: amidohydrolase [Candidatus Heimdallarchaeota archaeon]
MDLLIQDVMIIPEPDTTRIFRANIVIEDNIISTIAPNAKIPDPEFILKGKSLVALPPPINSHTHLPMTLLRGYSDNKTLMDWLQTIWEIEGKFDAKWIELGTRLACLEMMKAGTGGAADFYFHESKIGNVLEEAGIRGWLGAGILPSAFVDQGGYEFQLDELKRAIELAKGSSLLKASIAPHSQITVPEEIILKAADLAESYQIPLMIHASETRKEVMDSEDKYGVPPVERLDQIGFFREGTKEIIAHCTWITQREVEILGKHQATVGWCPVSAQKLAYGGVTPVPELRTAGAHVALGTDGTASNNTLDLWREMREASNVISASRWDPALYSAEQVLEDTCWSFRRNFHSESLIKVGNQADLVILNFQAPHLQPLHNIISNIVYAANGSDVHSLIVNGKLLMNNRQISTLNETKILEETEDKIEELL